MLISNCLFFHTALFSDHRHWGWREHGGGVQSTNSPYLSVPLTQFFLVLEFTEDDDEASQAHSITLPVSLVPTLPFPIICRAELFVCTKLPPTAHCAKLMFHPQHIDQCECPRDMCSPYTQKIIAKEEKHQQQHCSHSQKQKHASLTAKD